jgi:hypothetical protein
MLAYGTPVADHDEVLSAGTPNLPSFTMDDGRLLLSPFAPIIQ